MSSAKTPKNFSLYPLFRLAVCFASGIAVGRYSETNWKIALCLTLGAALLTAIFIKRKSAAVFIGLAFFAAGAFCFQMGNESLPAHRIKNI